MNGTIEFLVSYGYAALLVCVSAEQLGLHLPAAPFLLAAGALASAGKLNLAVALLLAVAASLIGDTVWYELGKTRGMAVLRLRSANNRRAKYYWLTAAGRKQLAVESSEWARLSSAVARVMEA